MKRFLLLFLVVLLGGACLPLWAENPYDIDDGLYALFVRGKKIQSSEKSLAVADTMLTEARRLGDKKAECLALTIVLDFYSRKNDAVQIAAAAETLRHYAREYDYLQYYYYAYTKQVRVLIVNAQYADALQILEQMRDEAMADQYYYGLATCYTSTGSLYYALKNYSQALDFYDLAIGIFKTKTNQSCAGACLQASFYCVKAGDFPRALAYVDTALVYDKNTDTALLAAERKGLAYFFLDKEKEFNKAYDDLMECLRQEDGSTGGNTIYTPILKDIVDGRYHDAEQKLMEKNPRMDSQIKFMALRMLYDKLGNYRAALAAQDSLSYLLQRSHEEGMNQNYAMMGARLDNERLKTENALMEAAHEKEQIEARHRINTLIIISLVIILVALSALLIVRKRSSDRLRQQNIHLEEARRRAEQSEQMKTAFIQNMTHEIRTPLNAVVGFSQLLADPQMSEMLSPEEKTEYGSLISNSADMLTQLVNDVLHMSDMQNGTLPVNREWCECNAIGLISTQNVEPSNTDNVRLLFTTELPDDFCIYTDRHRVQQILTNFLINAYKFTSSGEIRLHISRQETPGYVTFSVADTGPGIPADQAEYVFERFAKLDNFKPGFGLGLSICRQIAELLGGKVCLDTSYTDGARFVFIHPIEPDNR